MIVLATASATPLDKMQAGETCMVSPVLALPKGKAAEAIGVSRSTLYRQIASGKIRVTSYGTIPVTELQRHLAAEMERA